MLVSILASLYIDIPTGQFPEGQPSHQRQRPTHFLPLQSPESRVVSLDMRLPGQGHLPLGRDENPPLAHRTLATLATRIQNGQWISLTGAPSIR